MINPVQKEFPLTYTIDVKKFAEIFNKEHTKIYHDIKKAILNRFWERDIRYELEDGKIRKDRWLIRCEYHDKNAYVQIIFNPLLQPYLHQIAKNFTVYFIGKVTQFKSIYSIRLYEFFIMEINKAQLDQYEFILAIDEIKYRLELQHKYDRYCDFKSRVLNKAKSEINAYSDLDFDYEEIKRGRTVEKIKFKIKRKNGTKPARYISESQAQIEQIPESKPKIPDDLNLEMSLIDRKDTARVNLMRYGVHEKIAESLIANYPLDRIEHWIGVVKKDIEGKRTINDYAGYLSKCIRNNY